MKAHILSIGSELMAGRIADTNAAYLSQRLTHLGYHMAGHTAIGDAMADILAALNAIAPRADVCIVTGGIGPTPDDLTRQAFAKFCACPLVENADAAEKLRALFARRKIAPSPSNAIQATVPQCGEYVPNPTGTAAGFAVRAQGCLFFSLPGVPSEMKIMFAESVEPRLAAMSQARSFAVNLHAIGMGESLIGEKLDDVMGEGKNPEVATQAHEGVITVRVTGVGSDEERARQIVRPVEQLVRDRLGDVVFGADQDTLASVVARSLEQLGLTLAVAESCTGGEISARLTDVPGVSQVLLESAVTYSNESKTRRLGVPAELIQRHGAVSREVAEAMAKGMRLTSGASLALAVTGIAGPAGGSASKPVGRTYIALADADNVLCEEMNIPGDRLQIKDRAAKRALNMLRLFLKGRPHRNG